MAMHQWAASVHDRWSSGGPAEERRNPAPRLGVQKTSVFRTTGPPARAVPDTLVPPLVLRCSNGRARGIEQIQAAEHRLADLITEGRELEADQFDDADAVRALAEFDPVWASMTTREQTRLVQLLVAKSRP